MSETSDAVKSTLAQRAVEAIVALSQREGREITMEELTDRVNDLGGWKKPLDRSTVFRWITGKVLPPLDRTEVLAKVLGVRPGWLAFGDMIEVSWINVDTQGMIRELRGRRQAHLQKKRADR